jgi:antitoxin ParD1/3/4
MTDDGMPRRLPNATRAIVEERRIREYLLNLNHATGGPKARFFIAHGFASDAWNLLQASLTIHGREQDNQKHRHRVGYPPHGGMQLPNSGRAQPMHPDRMANGRRRTASADGDPAVGLPGWALCDIPFFVAPSLWPLLCRKVPRMLVSLTPGQQAWPDAHVARGDFASVEDAARRLIDERIAERAAEEKDDLAWAMPDVNQALADVACGDVLSRDEHRTRNAARLAAFKARLAALKD